MNTTNFVNQYGSTVHHVARFLREEYLCSGRRVTSLKAPADKQEIFHEDHIVNRESWALCALRIASWMVVIPYAAAQGFVALDEWVWSIEEKQEKYQARYKQCEALFQKKYSCDFSVGGEVQLIQSLARSDIDLSTLTFKKIAPMRLDDTAGIIAAIDGRFQRTDLLPIINSILFVFFADESHRYVDTLDGAQAYINYRKYDKATLETTFDTCTNFRSYFFRTTYQPNLSKTMRLFLRDISPKLFTQ